MDKDNYRVTVRAVVDLIYDIEDSTKADAIEEAKTRADNGSWPEDFVAIEIQKAQAVIW